MINSQHFIALLLVLISSNVLGQCNLLNYISDTVQLGECEIHYVSKNNKVEIAYVYEGKTRWLPSRYSMDCNQKYMPSVWQPVWHNDKYLGFHAGCGSWCFANILVPFNDADSVKDGGDVLIDTNRSVFFSLRRDTINWDPFLFIQNFNSKKELKIALNEEVFYGAILLERLAYIEPHKQGYLFKFPQLTLFVENQKGEIISLVYNLKSVY